MLLEANRLRPISLGPDDVGTTITLRAIGSGDVEPAEVQRLIDGRAMLPLAPVHGRILRHANGDSQISWIRRSRLGWAWIDGTDVPLGEERESYELRIMAGVRELRQWETPAPTAVYSEADRMADLLSASSDAIRIEIRQRGSWGLGRALVIAAL